MREPGQIGVEEDRLRRQRHDKFMAGGLDRGPRGLDGVADDVGQKHARAAQLHLVAADARDVEQVVDESHHMTELSLHHGAGLGNGGCVLASESHYLQAVA